MIQRMGDRLNNWLISTSSIQFDTDMSLEDCLRRLTDLANNPDAAGTIALSGFALEPADHHRYRLRMRLATLPRVQLEALLWEDEGITFVNGEVTVYRKYALYPLALVFGAAFLVWLILIPKVELLFMAAIIGAIIMLGIVGALNPTADYRTMLINYLYDLLDHEQVYQPKNTLMESDNPPEAYADMRKQKEITR